MNCAYRPSRNTLPIEKNAILTFFHTGSRLHFQHYSTSILSDLGIRLLELVPGKSQRFRKPAAFSGTDANFASRSAAAIPAHGTPKLKAIGVPGLFLPGLEHRARTKYQLFRKIGKANLLQGARMAIRFSLVPQVK